MNSCPTAGDSENGIVLDCQPFTISAMEDGLYGGGGGCKCQLTVKILSICQLSVKF